MTARKTKSSNSCCCYRAEPEPARAARAADLRHGHARRPRRDLPRRGRAARPRRSSTCSRTTRASSSTRSTAPGADAPRSSSTPARSPTTPGRSTTRSATFDGPSSSCTSPTRTPARRGATRRVVAPVATGTIVGFKGSGYASPALAVAELLGVAEAVTALPLMDDGAARCPRARLGARRPAATRCSSPSWSTSATSPGSPGRPRCCSCRPTAGVRHRRPLRRAGRRAAGRAGVDAEHRDRAADGRRTRRARRRVDGHRPARARSRRVSRGPSSAIYASEWFPDAELVPTDGLVEALRVR